MENDKCNLNETFNGDKSFYDNEFSDEQIWIKIKQNKKRVVITGDSMLNGIHEKRMFKNYWVKINSFPVGNSATILENIDQLVKSKSEFLIVHAGTNDLANGTNILNQVKKKQVKKISQNTKIVFSSIIIQKDRENVDKKGNSILANNFLKFLRSNFWNNCTD